MSIAPSPLVSIVIVTRNRPAWLVNCLKSLALAPASFEKEIYIVLNGPCESTKQVLAEFRLPYLECEPTSPAAARNLALKTVRGKWICFLDDDVEVPKNYFEKAQIVLEKNPDIFGGPDRTFPNARGFETAIGIALQSPLATASTRARHGGSKGAEIIEANEKDLILCNLWMKRSLFSIEGHLFPEGFFRNEENVLLFQLRKKKILYSSELFVFHHRKTSIHAFSKAVARSGYFRALSFTRIPSSWSLDFFIPSMFLIYCLGFSQIRTGVYLSPAVLYGALNGGMAVLISIRNKKLHLAPLISIYQLWITWMYGAGFLLGALVGCLEIFSSWRRDQPQPWHFEKDPYSK
ncbi:glycosyltransferase [bacterium]|nr:glycosyltransferase [bacterium]